MCSTFNGIHITSANEEDLAEWCSALDFFARIVAYIAVLALIMIVILMIIKYVSEYDEEINQEGAGAGPTETSPLLCSASSAHVAPLSYRSCEGDLESGNCKSSRSTDGESDDELCEGRLCVICYDEQRNSFFVPCGHCATCYQCAKRIFDGENKRCPVCRRLIGKVRKLLAA